MPMKSRATTRDARWYARDDAPRRWNAGENILARHRGRREVVREVATTTDGWMDSIEGRRYEETPRLTRLGHSRTRTRTRTPTPTRAGTFARTDWPSTGITCDTWTWRPWARFDGRICTRSGSGTSRTGTGRCAWRERRGETREPETRGGSESERATEDGGEGEDAGDARVETIGGGGGCDDGGW